MNKHFAILVILFFFNFLVKAQDAYFSSDLSGLLAKNPAFTGSTGGARLNDNLKNQFSLLSGDIITNFFSAEYYRNNQGFGLGFLAEKGGLASLSKTEAQLYYSYFIPLSSKWSASSGASLALGNSKLGYSNAVFEDQLNSDFTLNAVSAEEFSGQGKFYTDLNWGFLLYSDRYWTSASVSHILQPQLFRFSENSVLNRRYQLSAGGVSYISNSKVVNSNFKNNNKVYWGGTYALQGNISRFSLDYRAVYNNMMGVASLSNSKLNKQYFRSAALGAGVDYNLVQFLYCFEFNLNKSKTGGSHEIMLKIILPQDNFGGYYSFKNKKTLKTFCPLQ